MPVRKVSPVSYLRQKIRSPEAFTRDLSPSFFGTKNVLFKEPVNKRSKSPIFAWSSLN